MIHRVLMRVLGSLGAAGALAATEPQVLPARPIDVTAKATGIEAHLVAPKDRVEAGEPIAFRLLLTTARGIATTAPALDGAQGPFAVSGVTTSSQPMPEGAVSEWRFLARTYESGPREFPGLTIAYRDANGESRTLELAPVPIEVATLVSDPFDPAHFRDIKGPVAIDTGWSPWWIIAPSAFLAAGVAIWMLGRHRRAVAARALSPHGWAMQSLAALELDALVEKGHMHTYWVRLSDIVRQYIERRFDIAAPEQTTKEFIASVGDHPAIGAEHRHLLTDFLRAADMVKFAAHQPAATECARGMAAARGFVEDTTAAAEPARAAQVLEEASR